MSTQQDKGEEALDLLSHSDALVVQKRPIPVMVHFVDAQAAPIVVQTLEGAVLAQAGDPIITGVEGERWPVGRQRFEALYEPVHGTSAMGKPGSYRPKPLPVLALQMDVPFSVRTSRGSVLVGQPGDWLVQRPDRSQGVVAASIFLKTYEPFESPGDPAFVEDRSTHRKATP